MSIGRRLRMDGVTAIGGIVQLGSFCQSTIWDCFKLQSSVFAPRVTTQGGSLVQPCAKALSVKSEIIFIAALAASAINMLPAVGGSKWLAHVLVSAVTHPPL